MAHVSAAGTQSILGIYSGIVWEPIETENCHGFGGTDCTVSSVVWLL